MFPPCCLTWGQTMVGVVKMMVTSFNRSHAHTATLITPNPAACHCRPTPLPETPGDSQASLAQSLVGVTAPFSWVLMRTSFCFCPPRAVSQSCVSPGGSVVGLMATSSERANAIPRSAAPRGPALWQPTADPYLHRRCSNTVLSQSLWGPWVLVCTRFV